MRGFWWALGYLVYTKDQHDDHPETSKLKSWSEVFLLTHEYSAFILNHDTDFLDLSQLPRLRDQHVQNKHLVTLTDNAGVSCRDATNPSTLTVVNPYVLHRSLVPPFAAFVKSRDIAFIGFLMAAADVPSTGSLGHGLLRRPDPPVRAPVAFRLAGDGGITLPEDLAQPVW